VLIIHYFAVDNRGRFVGWGDCISLIETINCLRLIVHPSMGRFEVFVPMRRSHWGDAYFLSQCGVFIKTLKCFRLNV